MNATRVSYSLPSTLASINKAEKATAEVAAKSGFEPEECDHIALALREAVVNAVLHAHCFDPAKRVTLFFETTPEALTITVRDQGPGFDASKIPDPLAPENLLKSSGRGVFLIRAFMDEIRFQDMSPGTEVVMIKFIHGQGREPQ